MGVDESSNETSDQHEAAARTVSKKGKRVVADPTHSLLWVADRSRNLVISLQGDSGTEAQALSVPHPERLAMSSAGDLRVGFAAEVSRLNEGDVRARVERVTSHQPDARWRVVCLSKLTQLVLSGWPRSTLRPVHRCRCPWRVVRGTLQDLDDLRDGVLPSKWARNSRRCPSPRVDAAPFPS